MKIIKIYKRELNSITEAIGYLGNILEGCTASEETREGKNVIKRLQDTMHDLHNIRYRKQIKTHK